ncbi:MAG: CRTAC1 family protein [Thermoanaerobaculia bacterium]|nr:CRTAC1 family protein [Thermoanaerobaculia bacterium]
MIRLRGSIRALWPLLFVAVSCADSGERPSDQGLASPPPKPWFEEISSTAGVTFVHDSGHRESFLMPEIMSGGVALVDLDDDHDLDLYFVQGGPLEGAPETRPPNQLFLNRGDGTFVEATEGSGAGDRGYGMGVAAGDVDHDGDLDLYVTNVGPDVLLRNEGEGKFLDVTQAAGLGDPGWSSSALFADVDRDGDQDLVVTRYLGWTPQGELDCLSDLGAKDYCSPQSYDSPTTDLLYLNDGTGRFIDASESSGLVAARGTGLGIVAEDFDQDGWVDLFVANDGMADHYWHNLGDGRFEEQGVLTGCGVDNEGRAKAGMGATVGDVDRDGDADLLVCNLDGETDSLFLNHGSYFVDATAVSGLAAVSRRFTRFGIGWVDFDLDGKLDLYQANGRVTLPGRLSEGDPFAEANLLFRGEGDGRFVEVLPRGGTARKLVATSRAVAFGDIDRDGSTDLVVVNRDEAAHVLRNVVSDRGHWVGIDVRDEHGAPALGARLHWRQGGRALVQTVRSTVGYQGASAPDIVLGLGPEPQITEVQVEWVDGAIEDFGSLSAGGWTRLRKGTH